MNDNNKLNNIPVVNNPPDPNSTPQGITTTPRTTKSPILVGVICSIIGLIVGGLGTFGIMKLIGNDSARNDQPNPPEPPAEKPTITDPDTSFLKLESSSQNLIYSPLSIRYGLSLVSAGAAGSTKTQIDDFLGSTNLPKYQNVPDKLSLANAVFINESFKDKVLSSYTDTVAKDYDSEIIYDSFSSSANMDNWVKNKTFNLINSIGANITPAAKMVLANALAIQMDWQHQFESDDTTGRTFYQNDGSEITATTMNKTTSVSDISYYKDDDITLLSMPLQPTEESSLEFVAIMPKDLDSYIKNLDLDTARATLSKSIPASDTENGLEIYIPKFKFDYELDFKTDLLTLGITDAFSSNADFSNISGGKDLYISDAIHKANIDFSEKGIKAAAVTAFVMKTTAVAPYNSEPEVVEINRPFLFLIMDKNSDAIWFIGTVYQPNLWENDAATYRETNRG